MRLGESAGAAEPAFEHVVSASMPVPEGEDVVEQAVQGAVYPSAEQGYETGREAGRGRRVR